MPIHPSLARRTGHAPRLLAAGALVLALSACSEGFDFDLRGFADGMSTAEAARQARTESRPEPDARGIISYPTYQVAVARRGDTVTSVAERVGLPASELARFNGLPATAPLRVGEIVALPRRVAEPAGGPIQPVSATGGSIDVETLAGNAIDRSDSGAQAATPAAQTGAEPTRHQVVRGETAYSIARLYGVSVRSLADWNGLDANLAVREGQYLLIPPVTAAAPAQPESQPGQGTPTPIPPSAAEPLPNEDARPLPDSAVPASPNLGADATQASAARMILPVDGGRIIRPFEKGKTDGIDISAAAGTDVRAAAAGTVAAITRNTDGVPILVIRHADNVLTVYANIDNLTVSKGEKVKRGQKVAEVRAGSPSFLHFQVREGTTAVDPEGYLN